ncbi:uncharacterized protein RJT21DRAFT_46444 [Scheffersomyces amazonensis]|uniref:uncharacterized protein n=1 Tax=Scheffersomyces amazonensis TaxID=1078765 RepID=UPI00315D638C
MFDLRQGAESAGGPSTVTFFPDISMFERETDTEQVTHDVFIPDWILRQLGTLQSKLEAIESRSLGGRGRGGRTGARSLHSYSSHFIYGLANSCFGYNGWSSQVLECPMIMTDFDEENKKYSAQFSALVRVTLADGTYVESRGYGDGANLPNKYMCYNKGMKQAVTEATKNAIIGLRDLLIEYEMSQLEAKLKREYDLR